jgi:hypothetical protein
MNEGEWMMNDEQLNEDLEVGSWKNEDRRTVVSRARRCLFYIYRGVVASMSFVISHLT